MPVILSTVGLEGAFEAGGAAQSVVVLEQLFGTGTAPIVRDYHYDTSPWRRYVQQTFLRSGGGLLGVSGVRAVILGLTEVPGSVGRWLRLQPGEDMRGDELHFDEGPPLRFRPAAADAVLALELGVRSVGEARDALHRRPLPSGVSMSEAGFDFHGVELRLVD